tara:strand:+ start:1104 stop:2357 length:1254 start_codon:yes stop_codon:yes gene_type:complete
MAFYTSSIQTQLIDPRLDQTNKRAEFRFNEDTTYLSNLRLVNIGITATNATYNYGAGFYECIKSIRLLDGNTELTSTPALEFGRYMAFKNYQKENSSNRSINHFLNGSGMGYEVQGLNDNNTPSSKLLKSTHVPLSYDTTLATTKRGWLDLKTALPMLESILMLDTGTFKNLRLVIEYNSAVGAAQNTTAPLLIADAMKNEAVRSSMKSQFKGAQFIEVEHDRFDVAVMTPTPTAGAPNPVQRLSQQFKGFNNKVLTRLLVCKQPNAPTTAALSPSLKFLGSVLNCNEKMNIRVNGRTMLVGDGLDTPNKSLASITDTFGDCNSFFNQQQQNVQQDAIGMIGAELLDVLGEQDYKGFLIDERIEQAECTFSRTGEYLAAPVIQNDSISNMPQVLHFFGEVRKSISVNADGSYLISYM